MIPSSTLFNLSNSSFNSCLASSICCNKLASPSTVVGDIPALSATYWEFICSSNLAMNANTASDMYGKSLDSFKSFCNSWYSSSLTWFCWSIEPCSFCNSSCNDTSSSLFSLIG